MCSGHQESSNSAEDRAKNLIFKVTVNVPPTIDELSNAMAVESGDGRHVRRNHITSASNGGDATMTPADGAKKHQQALSMTPTAAKSVTNLHTMLLFTVQPEIFLF